ncbi:hypothetical protein MOO45_06005 [Bombilactobacillus folatiphilus]|uniref:WxL domain-containing protein n=1 Tax=Bombilactobacillus folatiphilus TaxID=2923362 RepID=A0ABY4P7R9_9LACO|nr:hypothetical protein [Bombilactobacillus folatiphilus]UQS81753.1 hypothetical protein MOO45_06005 [Bombilactobacillus folatiphilus]
MATKTAPPEITPNMIDDGFNSPEYMQEEQDNDSTILPENDHKSLVSLQLANHFGLGLNLLQYTRDYNEETPWPAPMTTSYVNYLAFSDTLGNDSNFSMQYFLHYIDDNGNAKGDLLQVPDYDKYLPIDNPNSLLKYYVVKDRMGQIRALKWLNYSVKDSISDGVIPNHGFLTESLITPSKNSPSRVNYQLFVKNISQSTYSYGASMGKELFQGGVTGSFKALGDNRGFTTRLGGNNVTVRTKVANGPNRYSVGYHHTFNGYGYFHGTNFGDAVGQEADNYPAGTVLGDRDYSYLGNMDLLWPVQKIAPQETQCHNVEIELDVAGRAHPVLTQSYNNPQSERFNHPGDKLNLQIKIANQTDPNVNFSFNPNTYYVNLPAGLSVTQADLNQIQVFGKPATASYSATTGQLKIVSSSASTSYNNFSGLVNIPVTIADDAPAGDAVVKTSFSGSNRDATSQTQTVSADAPDLTIPISKAFDAKLTLGVKNTKDTGDYASSATYVPGDTLQYHMQYQLNEANMYNLTSPVTFSSRNAGLDFSNSAPSVTVNGDRSAASATVDPNTGKITVTKASGNFSPGDLLDLTYNAQAKADPVAGEPGAKHESATKMPYNTVGINVTMNGQTLSNTSASTTLQRKDLDYFVRVPDVIDFGRNPRVFDSPFYNTTSGRLKFSHYSASSSKQYYLQVKYNQDLRTSAYAYLRPDSGNALIEYRPNDVGLYQSIDGTSSNLTTDGLTTQGISDLTSYVSDKHFRLNSNDKPLGNYSGTMTWTYSNSL